MFRVLSYSITPDSPVWPGNLPAVGAQPFTAIHRGDRSNTTILHLFSHSGTHLDAPKHYNDAGPSAWELPIEQYIFEKPLVLDVPKTAQAAILREDIEPYAAALAEADVGLLRTGWSQERDHNPRHYASKGPFLHPDGARFLMTFANLKAVGIDTISIATPDYLTEGIETHRVLTGAGRTDDRFVLILEDFRIDADLNDARRIYTWPLFIQGSDGSPCTIVAEFGD
ncbi:MAG: cyclase [Anaerolineaceae bacterium]|nr:cyclase [Anaerolineaceae bacterium]